MGQSHAPGHVISPLEASKGMMVYFPACNGASESTL